MSERYEVVFVNSESTDLLPPSLAAAYISFLLTSGPFQIYSSLTRSSLELVTLLSSPLQPRLLLAPVWNPRKQQDSLYGIPTSNEELEAIAGRLGAGYSEIDFSLSQEDDAAFENRVFSELVSTSTLRKIVVTVTPVIQTILKWLGYPVSQYPVIFQCQVNSIERTFQIVSVLQTAAEVQEALGGFRKKSISSAFPTLKIPDSHKLPELIKVQVSKEFVDLRQQLTQPINPLEDGGTDSIRQTLSALDKSLQSLDLRFSTAYQSIQDQVNSVDAFKRERKDGVFAVLTEVKSGQTRQRDLLDLLKVAGEKATSAVETLKLRIEEIEKKNQTLRQELAEVRVERKVKAFPIEIYQAGLNENQVLTVQIKSRKCYDLGGFLNIWREDQCVGQSAVLINIARTDYNIGQSWDFPPGNYIAGVLNNDGTYMSNTFPFSISEVTRESQFIPPELSALSPESYSLHLWHQSAQLHDPTQDRTLPANLQKREYPHTLVYRHTDNMEQVEEELRLKFPDSRLTFFRSLAVAWVNESEAQLVDFITTVLDDKLNDQQVVETLNYKGFQFHFNPQY